MNEIDTYLSGFERHLRILQALSGKSVQAYQNKVKEFFMFLKEKNVKISGKDILLQNITRKEVEDYLEWCFYKGNGNQTRFTKLIAVQKFFRYLAYEGTIQEDITRLIPKPRITRKFIQKFTKEDALAIFRAIDIYTEKGLRDVVIFILAFFGGLRVGEILQLTLDDIVDDGSVIEVNITEAKHRSNRTVYFWKVPSMLIRQWFTLRMAYGAKADDRLLASCYKNQRINMDGCGLNPSAINALLKRYAKKAGLRKPKVHIHMCRATHASDLRSIAGYDMAAIAERLGHKHISSTDRYFPTRNRIHRTYRSLAQYWSEFPYIWVKKGEGIDEEGKK